jgi:hypothetical protein
VSSAHNYTLPFPLSPTPRSTQTILTSPTHPTRHETKHRNTQKTFNTTTTSSPVNYKDMESCSWGGVTWGKTAECVCTVVERRERECVQKQSTSLTTRTHTHTGDTHTHLLRPHTPSIHRRFHSIREKQPHHSIKIHSLSSSTKPRTTPSLGRMWRETSVWVRACVRLHIHTHSCPAHNTHTHTHTHKQPRTLR